jgi:hypothetical protein
MAGWFGALQPALVGAVLVWAGALKLFGHRAPVLAGRSALPRLVGKDRAVPAYRTVGSVELGIGAVLVLPPMLVAEAVLATVLCLGLLGYLAYARAVAPESPCGCFGYSPARVRWRGFARAAALTVASGLAILGSSWWGVALASRPLAVVVVLAVEASAVVALSAELDSYWLLPLRRQRVRWRHPLAGSGRFDVPVASSVHQLMRSPAYRAAGGWLRSDLLDGWDEGEWRILSYSACGEGRPATAVFAVPRLRYEPADVKAALVDEADRAVLWQFAPEPTAVGVSSSTTITAEMGL